MCPTRERQSSRDLSVSMLFSLLFVYTQLSCPRTQMSVTLTFFEHVLTVAPATDVGHHSRLFTQINYCTVCRGGARNFSLTLTLYHTYRSMNLKTVWNVTVGMMCSVCRPCRPS
jgi:hypothetical protein